LSEAGVGRREQFDELLLETAGSLNMEAQELLESLVASANVEGAPDPVALLLQLRDELQLATDLDKEASEDTDAATSDAETDAEVDAKTDAETDEETYTETDADTDEVQRALDSLDRILAHTLRSEAASAGKGLLDVRVAHARWVRYASGAFCGLEGPSLAAFPLGETFARRHSKGGNSRGGRCRRRERGWREVSGRRRRSLGGAKVHGK
jgi:hypothetical protein